MLRTEKNKYLWSMMKWNGNLQKKNFRLFNSQFPVPLSALIYVKFEKRNLFFSVNVAERIFLSMRKLLNFTFGMNKKLSWEWPNFWDFFSINIFASSPYECLHLSHFLFDQTQISFLSKPCFLFYFLWLSFLMINSCEKQGKKNENSICSPPHIFRSGGRPA